MLGGEAVIAPEAQGMSEHRVHHGVPPCGR
jgi:hypothetical protein